MELMHLSLLILRMGSLVSREVLCIRCLESQWFRLSLVRAFPLSPQPPKEANRPLRRRRESVRLRIAKHTLVIHYVTNPPYRRTAILNGEKVEDRYLRLFY